MREPAKFETDHVNHDSVICLTPGLFRSVPKSDRKLLMEVSYDISGWTYTFIGPMLGAMEMIALQGLIALGAAGDKDGLKLEIAPDTRDGFGMELRDALWLRGGATDKTSILVDTTLYRLAKEIGYAATSFDSGPQIASLRKSLRRLWAVSILAINNKTGEEFGSRLLAMLDMGATGKDSKDRRLMAAINFRVSDTILGINKGYTRLEMAEIRALRSDAAHLIHQRLCAWIDYGKIGKIGLDDLCAYAWPEPNFKPSTMRMRRLTARKALKELEGLGWTVVEYADGKLSITRRGVAN